MVKPPENMIERGKTLEQRLADKFDDLQIAREDRQDDLFDELTKSIEILLKAVPNAYQELIESKEILSVELDKEMQAISVEVDQAKDAIQRQYLINQKGYVARWDFRELYEEIIMDITQKYGLVEIRKIGVSTLEPMQPSTMAPTPPEPEPQPVSQPSPKPGPQPHLMKKTGK